MNRLLIASATLAIAACAFDGSKGSPEPEDNAITTSFRFGADFTGVLDTEIDQDNADTNGSDVDRMRFDQSTGNNGAVMGLLRFDGIFGAAANQVPDDAEILGATLKVTVVNGGDEGAVCDMVTPWDAGTTWNSFGQDGPQSPTDFDPDPVAFAEGLGGERLIDVTPSIQNWHAGLSANEGWLFFPQGNRGVALATSENENEARRPTLEIVFMPAP